MTRLEPTQFIGNPVQAARVEVLSGIGWEPFNPAKREHFPGFEGLLSACVEYRAAEESVQRGEVRGAVLWVGTVVACGALRAGENAAADKMAHQIGGILNDLLPPGLSRALASTMGLLEAPKAPRKKRAKKAKRRIK